MKLNMSTLREIKLRIKSVKSTQKITKAMEMVAASKMRRAQAMALRGRPYINKMIESISHLLHSSEPALSHILLEKRKEVKKIGYLLITSNRGLCGAFNTNVNKAILEIMMQNDNKNQQVVTVGRKGKQLMERLGKGLLADFSDLSDKPDLYDTAGISRILLDQFVKGNFDEVYVVYNHFYSVLNQKPKIKKLFPIEADVEFQISDRKADYIFEGNKEHLLDKLLKRYIFAIVYQLILESLASEQSARMMAMRKASDSAKEIVGNLTLDYNKGRQAKITTQILEIVSGSVQN